jgi:hypothetical protein
MRIEPGTLAFDLKQYISSRHGVAEVDRIALVAAVAV